MKPRLLLIEPPFYRLSKPTYGLCKAPLGLASLAAAVQAAEVAEVRILAADFDPDPEPFDARDLVETGFRRYRAALDDPEDPAWLPVRRTLQAFRPDLVGLSVKTPAWASALACARLVRHLAPAALVVVGGPHPSAVGQAVLAHAEIDIAVPGEGEATLVALCEALTRGTPPQDVPGLLMRGRAWVPRPPLTNPDALPFPHTGALTAAVGAADWPVAAFGYVFSSRGCPFACTYCASHTVWGRRPRLRSPENLVAEIAALAALGVRHVHFDDDTFGVTPKRLLALCQALERFTPELTFGCETHVNLINPQTAAALRRAGFRVVQLGLESGDDGMLGRIGKGFTVARARRACALLKAEGLRLETFFMVGFPEETAGSLAATRRLMEQVGADKLIYSIFTPYPGTPLFDDCRRLGLIGSDHDWSLHHHHSPENRFSPRLGSQFRGLAAEIESFVSAYNRTRRTASPPGGPAWPPQADDRLKVR